MSVSINCVRAIYPAIMVVRARERALWKNAITCPVADRNGLGARAERSRINLCDVSAGAKVRECKNSRLPTATVSETNPATGREDTRDGVARKNERETRRKVEGNLFLPQDNSNFSFEKKR